MVSIHGSVGVKLHKVLDGTKYWVCLAHTCFSSIIIDSISGFGSLWFIFVGSANFTNCSYWNKMQVIYTGLTALPGHAGKAMKINQSWHTNPSGVSHSDGSCVLGRIHSDVSSNIPKKVYYIVTDNFVNLLHISYAWLYKTECWGRKFHAFSFNSHRNCKIFMTNFHFIFDTICVPYIFRKSIFGWNCDHDTPLCDTPLLEDTPLCDTPDKFDNHTDWGNIFFLYVACYFTNLSDWWRKSPWFSLISGCKCCLRCVWCTMPPWLWNSCIASAHFTDVRWPLWPK